MQVSNDEDWDDDTYNKAQEHFEVFFEEFFLELANYGEIEDLVVLDNVSEHMLGNVYVKFFREQDAEKCVNSIGKRFYGSKLLSAEYSPVSDFRDARCKAFHETRCVRGGLCNFMHVKHCPKTLKRRVVRQMYEEHPEFQGKNPNGEDRSRSPKRDKETSKRMKSEERKAMIAQWNKERVVAIQAFQPPPPPLPPPPLMAPV
jgi:splicing factor U2AF subunit